MSFIFVIGRPAWPRVECCRDFARFVIGPVAFWILFHDFERMLSLVKVGVERE